MARKFALRRLPAPTAAQEKMLVARVRASRRALMNELDEARYQARLPMSQLARRMGIARSALYRILDPEQPASVTLAFLERAAWALGKRLKVELG